jgi:enoyl-CoA hydratase
MIETIAAELSLWRDDPSIHAVLVESASDRAFCAGGDIRSIRTHAINGETDRIEHFFATEYTLNLAIHDYPKPYVALVDGICMGGGIGISVHGQIRVATEAAVFAMPETAIGMFPDIGATHFLPRLPGQIGAYLGLTGTRLVGSDAVHAGLATHFVPRKSLAALRQAIVVDGVAAIASFAHTVPPFSLAESRGQIDRCFGASTVRGIMDALQVETDAWTAETLAALRAMSPAALCWSLAAIRRGAILTLPQAFSAELSLTRAVTKHPDFAEGVRAMVVDKDRRPLWQPSCIEDVDLSTIAAMLV